ncbi:MAG: endolytic transglycosylase MltG [Mogibacterium sp.]|nr:endolytic transglycosylase MltG [Mogibacterium sp.]
MAGNEKRSETGSGSGIEKNGKRFHRSLQIVVALIVLAALALWGVYMMSKPYDRTRTTYADFVVEENDDTAAVAGRLEEDGIIKSASGFETLSKITFAGKFKPGIYYLSPSMDSLQILRTLQSGLSTSKGFTVPAGYTVLQLASALGRDGLADEQLFLQAAGSPEIGSLEILGENPEGLAGTDLIEGFLLPGDYVLSAEADESMMIVMMLDAFANFYNDDYKARADELGITTRQLLVIASMIESETSIDKERAAISGVIHNRINLELTPVSELPVKPLCFPSKESIIAALYPEDNEFTYYALNVSRDGTHRFTADENEYNAWIEELNSVEPDGEQP